MLSGMVLRLKKQSKMFLFPKFYIYHRCAWKFQLYSYYATYIDGKKKLEIDPLNYIYYVNGKDYLADVRKALGK